MFNSKKRNTELATQSVWRYIALFCIISLLANGCARFKPAPPIFEQEQEQTLILQFPNEPIPCIDTLAGAAFPKSVRSIPNNIGIGVFARTFTDAYSLVKRELEAGRIFVRVNLIWSDTHSFGRSDLKFIKSESARYQPLCERFRGRLYLAPLTEHNIKDPTSYLDAAQANAPDCTIVNTPWKGGYTGNPAYINEVHGSHSVPNVPGVSYAWSDDGRHSPDTDFTATKQKWKGAVYTCAWGRSENLRYTDEDKASRAQRIKEARQRAPSKEYQESLAYLFTDKGETSIPKKWIVKSHADYHGPGDTKGNKLLVISPVKTSAITLKRLGKKIASLRYYGPFDGGGFRYYASTWGYKLGAALDMFIGSRKYGRFNGGFRGGTYRN